MMIRKIFSVVALVCLASTFGQVAAKSSNNAAPEVIPALQFWKSSGGKYAMPRTGKITYPAGSGLESTARLLADDLKAQSGYDYQVAESRPEAGCINLAIGTPKTKKGVSLGAEGYQLKVADGIDITAPTAQGVIWGTRTLLQMLNTSADGCLAKGTALDYPDYSSRGFMLDVGRKFFTIDYLREYVKILSYYKMNEFQIHLNDNGFPQFFDNDWNRTYAAFRMESNRFPGLTAKDGHYGKEEFKQLQKDAQRYGVTIIPEIDVPAHSLALVHYKPNIGSRKYGMDHLDIYNPETYEFLDTLFDEYLSGPDPVFVGEEVHIGTDEYNKKEAEQFRYFTDRYLKYVKTYGKRPRMWGALNQLKGNTPIINDDVTINAWSCDWVEPVETMADGYNIINTLDAFLYIVPAAGYYSDYLNARWLYDNWTPLHVYYDPARALKEKPEALRGAMFAVWNDKSLNGITEKDVHDRTMPALQVLSQKMWGSPNPGSFDAFEAVAAKMPEAPGVNLAGRLPEGFAIDGEIAVGQADSLLTAATEIGYPYSVKFEICTDSIPAIDGLLFSSPNAKFYTNYLNTGNFAFERDGSVFQFPSYSLPAAQWVEVEVRGDNRSTSLYIDGQLRDCLEGRRHQVYNPKWGKLENMDIVQTLVFPLSRVGGSKNPFRGRIRNLSAGHTE